MSASRSSLGAMTLVLALAGIVAAAESSPSSPAASVSLESASVFADSSRETSPDSLLPISASMATDNVGNGSAVDVLNGDLGQGFDCDPTCNCHAEPLWVFRGGAIFLQRSTPTTSTLTFVPGGPSLINANDFHFGFRTGFEVGAIRRLNDCWDIDMRYLQIDSLNASVGPVDTESSAVVFQQRGSVVFPSLRIQSRPTTVRSCAARRSTSDARREIG